MPCCNGRIRLRRGVGLHQFHRHQGRLDRRFGDGLLRRRLARTVRRAVPHTRRKPQGRHHDARLRMGHGTLSDRHSPAARDLLDGGQHERTFAHHRRDDIRRPAGTGRLDRTDRLRFADLHHAPACEDGPRGHRHDRRAGQHLRLCVERRIILDRRPRRSVDHGADRQGIQGRRQGRQRQQGHRMGRTPHSRRICFGARQSGAHHDLPEERPRKLPLRARRRFVRPRNGVLRRPRCGFQLLRRICAARLRRPARLRSPRVDLLPHGGRRYGPIRGLCDGPQRRKPHAPVGHAPRKRSSTACATITREPRWT
mgnify:CR=1 FL=1